MAKNKFEWVGALWFGGAAAVCVMWLVIEMQEVGYIAAIGLPFAIYFGGRNVSKIVCSQEYSLLRATSLGVLITIKSLLCASGLLAFFWASMAVVQSGNIMGFFPMFLIVIYFSFVFTSIFAIPLGAVAGLGLRLYILVCRKKEI